MRYADGTKTIATCFCAFEIALSLSAVAAQPILVDEKLLSEGKIDIRPAYPVEAQAQGLTGSGVFVLHLNPKNGRVASIETQKSTGHKILDDAAIGAFGNLQFRTGLSRVTIPITFTNPGQRAVVTRSVPAMWLAETRPVPVSNGTIGSRRH